MKSRRIIKVLVLSMALAGPSAAALAELPQGTQMMEDTLPDTPRGWTAEPIKVADGVLSLYTAMHAQRSFRKDAVTITVAVARARALIDAVTGSLTTPALMPPGSRLETIGGIKAMVGTSSKTNEISVRYPLTRNDLVVISTRNGTLSDLGAFITAAELQPRMGR
jgi:hypothetical protein